MAIRKRKWTTAGGERSNWQLTYRGKDGKRHSKSFDRKKDADAYWTKVKCELDAGIHVPQRKSITVAQAGANWLDHAKLIGREPTTVEQYEGLLAHISEHIGHVKLADLSAPSVDALERQLRKGGMSDAMCRKVITALSGILARAVKAGHAAVNVAKGHSVEVDRRGKRKLKAGVDVPSREEVEGFLDAMTGDPWKRFFIVLCYTGMRMSEIRGLTWDAIDWDRETISVRQRADKHGRLGNPKSEDSERDIPMTPDVLKSLQLEWKASPKDRSRLVFATRSGKPHSLANIRNRVLSPYMLKAGIVSKDGSAKYTKLHLFRHFFASWCAAREEDGGLGLSLRETQQLLGHATLALTSDTYAHFWPSRNIKARMRAAESKLIRATRVQQAPAQIEA